jgi:YD repeat-containing protein
LYVNAASGNLVIQNRDELLLARGPDLSLLRTYNSQGFPSDGGNDNWRFGVNRQVYNLTGTVNTEGSTVLRMAEGGSVSSYSYDAAAGQYISNDGTGAYDTLVYDVSMQVWTWTDGANQATERYDATNGGRLIQVLDLDGNGLTYSYNGAGLITQITDASGESTYLDYSGANLSDVRTVTIDGSTLVRTRYGYDGLNRLTEVITDLSPDDASIADGNVYITSYTYVGSSARVATMSQSDGTSVAFTYVQIGVDYRVATITDALGRVTAFGYDPAEGTTTVTDALGLATTLSYDNAGQLLKVTAPAVDGVSQTTSYGYDGLGNVTSITDPRGNVVTYEYDSHGNRVRERDAAGNTIVRTFGARNELLTETTFLTPDPDGAGTGEPADPLTARYVYDANDHLRFVVSAEGRVTEYRYDAFGQQIASIQYAADLYALNDLDPTDALTEAQLDTWVETADKTDVVRADTTYDFRGQAASVTTYASVDASGNGVMDGTEAVTRYAYDQAGNLLTRIDARGGAAPNPSGYTTGYAYDGLGRLLATTDALGNVTSTQYDDAHGKTVLTLANGLTTTSTYDSTGELVSVVQSAAGQSLGKTKYFYDADGRLRRIEDPAGVDTYLLYDEAGRKVATIDGNGSLTEYRYDADDNLTKTIRYANAASTTSLALLTDGQENPTNVALAAICPAPSADDRVTWKAYDTANRLVKSIDEAGYVTQYFYNGAGNLTDVLKFATAIDTNTLGDTPDPASIDPISNGADRLTKNLYDEDSKLRGTLDSEGYLVEYRYDAAGELIETIGYASATDPALRSTGTLAQLRPPASAADIHSYTFYNARGQVVGTLDGEGYLTENAYDAAGNKTQVIRYATRVAYASDTTVANLRPAPSAQDQVTSTTYTALNQVASTIAADGTLTRFSYDEVGNLVQTVRGAGASDARALLAQYDRQGRLTAELSAKGAALLTGNQTQEDIDSVWAAYATTYTYDAAGRKTSSTDADGHRTLFYYNADGQLTDTIDALGEVQESIYNALGELTQTIQYGTRLSSDALEVLSGGLADDTLCAALSGIADTALDSKTTYAYTARGQVASTTDALGNAVTQTFDAFGDVTASSQALGAGQTLDHTYTYDRRGFLTQTVSAPNGLDSENSTVYDAFGRAIKTIDANGNVRTRSYDKLGRVVSSTDPVNQTVTSTYDAFGRMLTQTDALGKTTAYSYDAADRAMTVTTPEGVATTTLRNAFGQVVSVTDGRGNTTSYQYDHDGNLVQVDAPGVGATTKLYDQTDLLVESVDANGTKTGYAYDAANRLLTRTVDPGDGLLNLVTSYAYDAKGNAVTTTDANGVVTQTSFDLEGQVTSVTVDPGAGHLNLTTTYVYDARGKELAVTQGAGGADEVVTLYSYDTLGRLIEARVDPTGVDATTAYSYDGNGNIVAKTDALGFVTRYAYNADDRLIYTIDALGDVTQNGYDGDGRVTRVTRYATPINLTGLSDSATPAADVAARVVASAADETKAYVYDGDGRELDCIDAMGAVTQKSYDATGNVAQTIKYANAIEAGTALTQAAIAAAIAPDAANDRVASTVYDAAGRASFLIDAAGDVTRRIYDGDGNVVKEIHYANALQGVFTPGVAPQIVTTALASGAHVISDATRDQVSRFIYDAAGRLRYGVDAEGCVTECRYDALGHEIERIRYADRVSVADGMTEAGVAALLPAEPSASAVVEGAQYDAAGRLSETTDGEGNVTHTAYDALGNKIDVTVAYGTSDASTTHYSYDSAGREVGDIRGFGTSVAATTRYVLDALGNRVQIIDPRGVELSESDSAWAFATRTALGYVDSSGNAKLAAALSDTEKNSLLARYTTLQQFDGLRRMTRTTDALGHVTAYVYDAFGDTVEVIDPRGNAGYFYFDQRNQAVLHVDPEGYATQSVYDGFGNVVQTVRYANRVVGNVSTGTAPAIVTSVPANGPYVLINPAHDQFTTVQYDARNDETKVTDADGSYEQYSYDAFGNKLTTRNKLGGITSYTYDRTGHMLTEALPITSVNAQGQSVPVVNRYEYDARGNRTKQIQAYGLPEQLVTQYQYDKLDRQVVTIGEAVHVFDTATLSATGTASPMERKQYDARGNLIETDAANGARILTYYDALDRKVAQIDALGALTIWQYNEGSTPIAELQYGDPVALPAVAGGTPPVPVNAANVRVKYFTYDANNALVQTLIPSMLLGEQAVGASAYSTFTQDIVTKSAYDADGNEVQAIDARGHSTFSYYDRLGRKILQVDPAGYVTRWEYDASGNVIRETQYANQLSLAPSITSDVDALLGNVGTSSDDRITEFDYDGMGRVVEKRTLNVDYGTVDANGALTSASGVSRTQTQYNGLGQITRQIDATGAQTDFVYDLDGRKVREQDPQYTDFQGNLVRPTTDFEYDGLDQVRRQLVRGTDNTTEAEDHVTTYQYDYGYGARLISRTDATGATTNFACDVSGYVTYKSLPRTDANGNTALDQTTYGYDVLGREIEQTDLGTGQTSETRYDLYSEITGKRTDGGGAGGTWQETTAYDNAGRVWMTNSGDGVYKAYLYDANGNATLQIQSAGPDLSRLTLDQVMVLPGDQKYLTISQYDARNKLIGTWQPQINTTHDQAAIEQFITQQTGTTFSGGAVSIGAVSQSTTKPQTGPALSGTVSIGSGGTTAYSTAASGVVAMHRAAGFWWYAQGGINSTITLPSAFSELGAGNFRVNVHTGYAAPWLNTTYDANNYFSDTSTSFTVPVFGSCELFDTVFGPASFSISINIYKQTPFGDRLLTSYQLNTTFGGPGAVAGSSAAAEHEVHFEGQAPSTSRLILQYRLAGTNTGWSSLSVPAFTTTSGVASGWFAFDWAGWARGTYDIRYTALDASGNVLNSESGTMVLSNSSPSITQTLQQIGGVGRAFMSADGKLNILEQGSNAQTLTVRYRHTGSSEAWTSVTLSPATIGGASTPGWFVFDPAANGMSGAYDYWIEAKDGNGNQVNKALGSFSVGNGNSVAALTGYQDLPEMVHFLSQPTSATSMKLLYRPSGSTGAYTTVWLTKVGTGAFDWDATALVIDRLSNYGYEYQYETYDAGNALVNKAHGVLQLGANPAMLSHINDTSPTLITFNPPQTGAMKLVLQYRTSRSSGAYMSVTLTRADGTQRFTWDASSVVPPGTTANLDYFYDLYDGANVAVVNADGTAAHVAGAIAIGAASAPAQLKWVIVGSSNEQWAIHRQQTYDAFGDVVQEIDGLGHVTDFSYNALGLLVEKRDPETNITLANGFVTRGRPTTDYTHDLSGRLVAVKDANGNLNRQQLLAGSGANGKDPLVLTEFHADGGRKSIAYDIFGDARALSDEIGRVTLQAFDKEDRLIQVNQPARVANTPGNQTNAAVAAVDTYSYDQAGNRISHTNTLGEIEKTYYDNLGRVTQTTSFAGNSTLYSYAYDSTIVGVGGKQVGGWVKTTTDPTGHTMLDNQELFGRVVSHKDLGDHTFTYVYNYAGRLTSQTGSSGQNILYDYYANGYLKSINDQATGSFTKYEYDAEGNRTLEAYTQNVAGTTQYYEYAQVTYDELNRVAEVLDPQADIRYEYDANGNRRRVWSYYHDGVNGSPQVQDYWYAYDSMNRFTTTMGKLSGSGVRGASATDTSVSVVTGSTGVQIGYNPASERTSAIYGSDGHLEDYSYTADGYLEDTKINGALRARRYNDILGRVVQYQEFDANGAPSFGRVSSYDNDNKLLSQQEYNGAVGGTLARSVSYDYIDAPGTNDNAGPLASTVTVQYDTTGSGGGNTTIYSYYSYEWWDDAKEKTITSQPYNPNAPGWLPGYSNFEYDANGHLKQVDDPMGGRAIRYVTDAQGQVLVRDEISGGTANAQGVVSNAASIDKHHVFYYLDEHRIGDVGNDGPLQISYAEDLAAAKTSGGPNVHKNWKPISSADFDQNFDPINSSNPPATASLYTVRTGDTLRSIALAEWGDADLWYLIADTNGLAGNSTLIAGQILTIPNKVTNIHNNSQTYQVYSPGQAIGDTTPTLPAAPPPPVQSSGGGGGCGGLGEILVTIVVIVVAYYTEQWWLLDDSEAAGAPAAESWDALAPSAAADAGMLPTSSYIAAGAVGAAAGNVAGQLVATTIGIQHGFNYKSLATDTLMGGIGGAFGNGGLAQSVFGVKEQVAQRFLNGALNDALAQELKMVTGQQQKFDWHGVAVGALASTAEGAIRDEIGGTDWAKQNSVLGYGADKFASSLTSGVLKHAISGQQIDYANIAATSVGALLGKSLVDDLRDRQAQRGTLNDIQSESSGLTVSAQQAAAWWSRFGSEYSSPDLADYGLVPRGMRARLPSIVPASQSGSNADIRTWESWLDGEKVHESTFVNNSQNAEPSYVDPESGIEVYPLATTPKIEEKVLPPESNFDAWKVPGLGTRLGNVWDVWRAGGITAWDALNVAGGEVRAEANSYNNEYQISTRVAGGLQAAGGATEVFVGANLSSTLVGAIAGVPIYLHGIDNTQAGLKTAIYGQYTAPETVRFLQEDLGLSPFSAQLANDGLGLAGTFGPGMVRSVVVGRAEQARIAAELDAPASRAAAWQGSGNYPGVDTWVNQPIPKGTILAAGVAPGRANTSGFYTTVDAFVASGQDANLLFRSVQAAPWNDTYRPAVGFYEVTEETQGAFSYTRANPWYGKGGAVQFYIPTSQPAPRLFEVRTLENTTANLSDLPPVKR